MMDAPNTQQPTGGIPPVGAALLDAIESALPPWYVVAGAVALFLLLRGKR